MKETLRVTLSRFLGRSGTLPRVRRLSFLLALVACIGTPSTASAAPAFRDTVLTTQAPRALQATAEWGGPTVATNGERVTIFFSDAYPVDAVRATQWADFMTSLVHGPELATVTIHLAPLAEVQRTCGVQALACYSPRTRTIYAPGEDPEPGTSAKGVLTHEYGHHLASSRSNPPFPSVAYGTKRWASYENVCARVASGDFFPGAEDAQHYMLNPGEAFAETYRVLNEQRLGLPQEPWDVVTRTLYPDASALSLVEQDVVKPWTENTALHLTARLNGKTRTRTFNVSTPYDGTLTVVPRQVGGSKVGVSLLANRSTVKTSSFRRAAGASLSTTVCGLREYRVRVTLTGTVAKTAKTTVTLSVSTP
jgi:hypothetical protein